MENSKLIRQRRNNRSPSLALPPRGGGKGWGFGLAFSVVSLAFFIAVSAVAVAAASAPRVAVILRAESTVRGQEIRLGDIAEIETRDAALLTRLRGIEVARAPLPGLTRTIDLPYLKARLRLQQIDPSSFLWDVPASVSVTTASQRVGGEDLLARIRQHILAAAPAAGRGYPADRDHLSIQPGAVLPDLTLPAGALELKVRSRSPGELTGSVSMVVEAWVDGALIRSVSVPVRVSALFDVLVAARPIARHALLGAPDVRVERREVLAGQASLRELGAVLGRRAVRAIPAGEPILATLVELPPLVRRGDIVLLTAEGRGLRAVAQGEAREEGKAGQVIRVRNLTSGREVYGQVEAEGTVRVPF